MEPITAAIIAGCSALVSGGTGWYLGSRSEAPEIPASIPTEPGPDRAEVEALNDENRMLRSLIGIAGIARQTTSEELFGTTAEAIGDTLADVLSSARVRSAVVVLPNGMTVRPGTPDKAAKEAVSLLSRLWSASPDARRISIIDDLGNYLEAHRIRAKKLEFYIVTVSKGQPIAKAIIGRCRYRFEGLTPVEKSPSRTRVRVASTDAPVADVLARMSEACTLNGISLFNLDGKVETPVVEQGEYDDIGIGADTIRCVSVLAEAFDALGTVESIVVDAPRGTHGFHPFDTARGEDWMLHLVTPTESSYPESRISKWTGQLAWQIPRLEKNKSEQETKRAAGGTS